jgi:hypothetical protein
MQCGFCKNQTSAGCEHCSPIHTGQPAPLAVPIKSPDPTRYTAYATFNRAVQQIEKEMKVFELVKKWHYLWKNNGWHDTTDFHRWETEQAFNDMTNALNELAEVKS